MCSIWRHLFPQEQHTLTLLASLSSILHHTVYISYNQGREEGCLISLTSLCARIEPGSVKATTKTTRASISALQVHKAELRRKRTHTWKWLRDTFRAAHKPVQINEVPKELVSAENMQSQDSPSVLCCNGWSVGREGEFCKRNRKKRSNSIAGNVKEGDLVCKSKTANAAMSISSAAWGVRLALSWRSLGPNQDILHPKLTPRKSVFYV